jgi:hypothetical protein
MKTFDIKLAGLYILALIIMALIITLSSWHKTEKVYDCGLAEISPDYPRDIVEECRAMRREEYAYDNRYRV